MIFGRARKLATVVRTPGCSVAMSGETRRAATPAGHKQSAALRLSDALSNWWPRPALDTDAVMHTFQECQSVTRGRRGSDGGLGGGLRGDLKRWQGTRMPGSAQAAAYRQAGGLLTAWCARRGDV